MAVTGCGGGGSSGGGGGGVTVSPETGSLAVPTNTEISATFATDVDPSTLTASTFRVRGPGSQTVPGTISYNTVTKPAN